jgi:hypothetical protein
MADTQLATADQIAALYQQLLGRTGTSAEYQNWEGGTLAQAQYGIANSQEGLAYANKNDQTSQLGQPGPGGGQTTTPAATTGPTGDAKTWLAAQLNAGVDPQTAINQLNAAGGQYAALAAANYPTKGAGVVGIAGGGYYAKNEDGTWGWNVGDSADGGTTTPPPAGPAATAPPPGPSNPAYTISMPSTYQPWTVPFSYPDWTPPPAFTAPTADQAAQYPGYQFQLQQGEQALQRQEASQGTALTGGSTKDATAYAEGLAQTDYGNVYNQALTNYQTLYNTGLTDYTTNYNKALAGYDQAYNIYSQNNASKYNMLSNLAGLGQVAAGQLGTQGLGYSQIGAQTSGNAANTIGGLYGSAANASAAGTVGSANAISGGLTNFSNTLMGSLYNNPNALNSSGYSGYPGGTSGTGQP